MNLNMEKIVIKYRFRIFYIPKDRFLVIFEIVVGSFAQNKKKCNGHQFLEYVELLYKFQHWSVEEKKVYFKYFYFHTFRLTSDNTHTLKPTKIEGWIMLPVNMQVISHLTYSQRLSFLR